MTARPSFRSFLALSLLALPAAAQHKPLFDAPEVIADVHSRIVTTLDLDGDGWADAIGWWQTTARGAPFPTATLTGWINDQSGNLVRAWDTTFPINTLMIEAHDAIATGDLNGDGQMDFVISNHHELRVYLSNGAALPTLAIVQPYGTSAFFGIAMADFDGDGALDLAVNHYGVLEIRRFDFQNGTLPVTSQLGTIVNNDGRLIAAELTGDTTPDLIVGGCRIYPVLNGSIQAPLIFPPPFTVINDPKAMRHDVGDIDGDGDLDVVTFLVTSGQAPQYRVLRRTGPSTFVQEAPQLGGPARRLVDLDGDGDLDGVCCGGGGGSTIPLNDAVSSFRIALNDGTGNFAAANTIPGLGSTAIAGVVDLDHDGHLDLVAGRCVYYGRGPLLGSPFRAVGTRVQCEETQVDCDGDGDIDTELTAQGVLANLGDGSESARTHVLPPPPQGLTRSGNGMVGDWDGDGDMDLLVLLGSPNAPAGLELLRNIGCGVFDSAGVVCSATGHLNYPTSSEDSLAVDMDGDGDLDLVRRTRSSFMPNPLPVGSSWWRNDGAAGFTFMAQFPNTIVMGVGDMNGDGLPDVFGIGTPTSGLANYPVVWAAGLGSGTFGTWNQGFGISGRPAPADQFSLADVDGDGDLDVLAISAPVSTNPEARLYLNNGLGTFGVAYSVDLASNGSAAALVADLNVDGLPDVVFGPLKDAPDACVILLRKSDNTDWEAPIQQVIFEKVSSTAWNTSLVARDPDGDRDLDLISDRRIDNRTFELPDAGSRRQLVDGTAGGRGIVPTLGATGPFRVHKNVRLRLRGARPGANGWLAMSYVDVTAGPFGGGVLPATRMQYVPITTSGLNTDPDGSGTWTMLFTVPAYDAGRSRQYVLSLDDPAAPGGLATSNTLLLSFGP